MTQRSLSCADLDALLPDYLEGTSSPAERRLIEHHLSACVRCTALVRDLRAISADAGALPMLEPSRDLWSGIAERIEAPVIPLPAAAARARSWSRPARLAAVAAGLVAVTAGITYQLTVHRIASAGRSMVAVQQPALPGDSSGSVAVADTPRTVATSDSALAAATPGSTSVREASEKRGGAPSYADEIHRLRDLLADRRAELDPRTAAILDNNLKVIDDAIAQSRDALAEDPASRFLTQRLDQALQKKVSLLKTAVSLPKRT